MSDRDLPRAPTVRVHFASDTFTVGFPPRMYGPFPCRMLQDRFRHLVFEVHAATPERRACGGPAPTPTIIMLPPWGVRPWDAPLELSGWLSDGLAEAIDASETREELAALGRYHRDVSERWANVYPSSRMGAAGSFHEAVASVFELAAEARRA